MSRLIQPAARHRRWQGANFKYGLAQLFLQVGYDFALLAQAQNRRKTDALIAFAVALHGVDHLSSKIGLFKGESHLDGGCIHFGRRRNGYINHAGFSFD
ncbi:MAG: hypothetical protein HYR94_14075 [Chloroflexi bacterium]|nr:hypothetical protein [Chloroflexota bacterium]